MHPSFLATLRRALPPSGRGLRPFLATLVLASGVAATPAQARFADATPAATAGQTYAPLEAVGASASDATLRGRTLSVRVSLRGRATVRLAIVEGNHVTAAARRRWAAGDHRFHGAVGQMPRGRHLVLRVTVRLADGRRARGRLPIEVRRASARNRAPRNLTLATRSLAENLPVGTVVGRLHATDPDGDRLTYTLVRGTGGPDSGAFTIAGTRLRAARTFDFETKSSYVVRVRAADRHGNHLDRSFTVRITGVDDAPVVTIAASPLAYRENDAPVRIDPSLMVGDPDSPQLSGATVRLSGAGFQPDTDALAMAPQSAITAAYDAVAGTLTLSGSAPPAAYEAALRAVTYVNTSDDPRSGARSITVAARDAASTGSAATRRLAVTPVNDPPVLTTSSGRLSYPRNDPARAVDALLTLRDPDSQIQSATARITAGYVEGQDVLALPTQPGLTSSFDHTTGTLTLSGAGSPAAFQSALEAVTYRNTSGRPDTRERTVTFTANDGADTSAPATRRIAISSADDPPGGAGVGQPPAGAGAGAAGTPAGRPPDVTTSAGTLSYTEGDAQKVIDPGLRAVDPDSANLVGATVRITSGYANGEDTLALPAQPNITASFDQTTGTLTLAGTDTLAAYQAALRAVTYENSGQNPSTARRTVGFAARDATGYGTAGTRDIAVSAVDDAPRAVNDSATVTEDSGANAIGVLANDTDVDGGPKSIASVTQPATGTVAITGGGTGLTYTPAANDCQAGGGAYTFTYTLTPGGSTATVSVTVSCLDDAPVAVADAATVTEDSGANAIDVLANDTDVDGGPKSIASVTQPANGTVAITGGGTGLTYTPAADYCNDAAANDSFTYTLTPGGNSATVSLAVTCVSDSPTAVDDPATVAEDSGANAIDVLANDTDPDGGPKSIASVTQPANGTVVITGGGTGLTYAPNADYCNSAGGTPDTFGYTLTPGGSTATVSVTVTCIDDPPTAVGDSATVTEHSGAGAIDVLANDTDVDGGPKSVASVTQPANGTVVITGGGTGLTYAPNANYCNDAGGTPDTFTYTLTPGASTATVSVTVSCVDDPPVAVGDSATVAEDSAASAINVLANDTDPDGGPQSISSVTQPANGSVTITGGGTGVSYTPNANYCNSAGGAADTFTYTLTPGSSTATVGVTVTCSDDAPVAVGDTATITEDSGANAIDVLANDTDVDGGPKSIMSVTQPANGTVTITGGGTGLTYTPAADYCNDAGASDTFTYTLTPGGSSAGVGVNVTCVNDAPSFTKGANQTAANQTAAGAGNSVSVPGWATNISAGPAAESGQTVSFEITGDDHPELFSTAPAVAPDGTLTFTTDATRTGTAAIAIRITDNGGTARGGVDASSTQTFTITTQLPPPVAFADPAAGNTADYAANGGVPITIPASIGVLANDQLYGAAIVSYGGTSATQQQTVGAPTATAGGGSVTVSSDGSFAYDPPPTPPAGGSDTFRYRIGNTSGTSDALVTISVSGQAYFVDNTAAAGGTGSLARPLRSLDDLPSTRASGGLVYVMSGSGTYGDTATLTLKDSEILAGQAVSAASVVPFALKPRSVALPSAGSTPTITAAAPATNGVSLGSGNTLRGFDIGATPGAAITGTSFGTLTVGSLSISSSSQALSLTTGKLAGTFGSITSSGGTNNIALTGVTTTGTAALGGGALSGASAEALKIDGQDGSFSYGGTIRNGFVNAGDPAGVRAVDIANKTGGSVTLSGAVNPSTSLNGIRVANNATGTNTITFSGAEKNISTGTAAAVSITGNSSGTTVAFTNGGLNVDTSSGAGFTATGAGTVEVTTGANPNTIDASGSGRGLDVQGVDASANGITFQNVVSASGQVVNITSSGGTKSLGKVSTSSGSTPAMNLSGAGTVNLGSGTSSSLQTTSTAALVINGTTLNTGAGLSVKTTSGGNGIAHTGGTVSIAGGSLTVDSDGPGTDGSGIVATSGGTLDVQGAGNTITSGTQTALKVANTTIGDADLTFRSITTNGASNGIVLTNTTNANGRLIVDAGGSSTAGAGGTIQGSTGTGIALTSVPGGVSLARMSVTGSGDDGISATTVAGFSLANSTVSNNGNSSSDNGIELANVTGTVALTSDTVSANATDNVSVIGTSGTVAMTVSGGSYSSTSTSATGDDGILFEGDGTGSMTLAIQGPITFSENRGDHVQVATDNSATVSQNVTIDGATMSSTVGSATISGGGVAVTPGGGANVTASLTNSTITGAHGDAVRVDTTSGTAGLPTTATVNAKLTGNTIGTAADSRSGSYSGNGVEVISNGASTVTAQITGNAIRQYTNIAGIRLAQGDGTTAKLNATVTQNTLANPSTALGGAAGVDVRAGLTSTPAAGGGQDAGTMCLDLGGAGALANSLTGAGSNNLAFGSEVEDVFVWQRFGAKIELPGLGATTTDAAAASYLKSRNGGTPTTYTETTPANSGFLNRSSSCPTPP